MSIDILAVGVARHWWCARSSIAAQHAIVRGIANSPHLPAVCLMGRRRDLSNSEYGAARTRPKPPGPVPGSQ